MTSNKDIPWFNPRQMDDNTVKKLSTAREELFSDFKNAVQKRIDHPSTGGHWLIPGPRGSGKSFFLRLVQVMFSPFFGDDALFVLLPEELPNVHAPHEFLKEIERMLPNKTQSKRYASSWRVQDESGEWEKSLQSLLKAFPQELLVIGVENFDEVLENAFKNDVRASRLRRLLENEPRVMFIATAVAGEFDEAYDQRLFRQFEHHSLRRWDEDDHKIYLERRAELLDRKATNGQLARIDAYSRYTGGSARIAAVLAAAILDEEDPIHASSNLTATLDRMSDYYRSLIEKMPSNSSKLFDALISGGEPTSQVKLAERIGARQSDISKAFSWLIDYGYVMNDSPIKTRAHSYRVTDRLFVQFYRMRYIEPDQPCQLAILADLLAVILENQKKWSFAEVYLSKGQFHEAELMVKLACLDNGIVIDKLPAEQQNPEWLIAYAKELGWFKKSTNAILKKGKKATPQSIFENYTTDADFIKDYEKAKFTASSIERGKLMGFELVALLENSISLTVIEKYEVLLAIMEVNFTEKKWRELVAIFKEEVIKFAELENEYPLDVKKLKKMRKLEVSFPFTFSLSLAANKSIANNKPKSDSIFKAVYWASEATILWIKHKQQDAIIDTFYTLRKGVNKLLQSPYAPQKALEALIPLKKEKAGLPHEENQYLHEMMGSCYSALKKHNNAIEEFQKARELALEMDKQNIATFYLGRSAWCYGAIGKVDEAIEAHELVISERKSQSIDNNSNESRSIAWNIGQIARYHLSRGDSDKAWQLIDSVTGNNSKEDSDIIQQLGDAVSDYSQAHIEAETFAFAVAILTNISERPCFNIGSCIRVLWIDMVEMGVSLTLLEDLLSELPIIFTINDKETLELVKLLGAWLDYLSLEPSKRKKYLKNLDPDLGQTLISLTQELSYELKHRYRFDSEQ